MEVVSPRDNACDTPNFGGAGRHECEYRELPLGYASRDMAPQIPVLFMGLGQLRHGRSKFPAPRTTSRKDRGAPLRLLGAAPDVPR